MYGSRAASFSASRDLFIENIFLRAGREIRAGSHRDRSRKHRGKSGNDDNQIILGRSLDTGEQSHRADQSVLNAKDKLADPRAAFDNLLFSLDGVERHGKSKVKN